MNDHVVAVVMASLLAVYAQATWQRVRGPPDVGPVTGAVAGIAPRIAIDHVGRGLACVPTADACGTLSARRRLLIGAPLELGRASRADLEALPGIGPALASRLLSALPIRNVDDLARVRGLGPQRAHKLAPLLGLDADPRSDICSLGSWPTTSSACAKPR